MAMTHDEKIQLARMVKQLKELGYSKTSAIQKIHDSYKYKKRTINVYWKTFNE